MIDRLVRRREVCERTGLSYTTIWRLEKRGLFPRRRQLNPSATGINAGIAWLESEISQWIHDRIKVAGRVCRRLITTEPRHEARRARAAALKARRAPCRPSQGAAFSNTRKPTASYYCKSIFRILSSVCARRIPG